MFLLLIFSQSWYRARVWLFLFLVFLFMFIGQNSYIKIDMQWYGAVYLWQRCSPIYIKSHMLCIAFFDLDSLISILFSQKTSIQQVLYHHSYFQLRGITYNSNWEISQQSTRSLKCWLLMLQKRKILGAKLDTPYQPIMFSLNLLLSLTLIDPLCLLVKTMLLVLAMFKWQQQIWAYACQ